MKLFPRVGRAILRPFQLTKVLFASDGPIVGAVSPERARYNAAVARSVAAPMWRKLIRLAVVLIGLGIFGGAQYFVGTLIYTGDWLQVIGLYLAIISIVLAATNPPLMFGLWLILSPYVALFMTESIGGGLMQLDFDRLSLLLLTIVLVSRSLVNRYPVRKLLLPEWLLLGSVFYSMILPLLSTRITVIHGTSVLLASLVQPFAMYCIARACIREKSHLRVVVYAVFIMGMLWAVSGWYEHFSGRAWLNIITRAAYGIEVGLRRQDIGGGRACGPTNHYYTYGEVLTLTTLLALHLSQWSKRSGGKVFYYLCAVVASVALYFGYSRAPYLAFAVGLLAMVLLSGVKRKQYLAFVLMIVMAVAIVYPIVMKDRAFEHRMSNDENYYARVTMLQTGLNIIRNNFWFGVGKGNIGVTISKYVVGMQHLSFVSGGLKQYFAPHNEYVVIWAEQGLLGFVLFFGGMFGFMWHIWKVRRRLPAEGLLGRNFASIVLIYGIVHAVTMFSDQFQTIPYSYYILYPVFALVVRLDELGPDSENKEELPAAEQPSLPPSSVPAPLTR